MPDNNDMKPPEQEVNQADELAKKVHMLEQELQLSRDNELAVARIALEYLIKERAMLRGALEQME